MVSYVTARNITGQAAIEDEHIRNNDAVRRMMISRGIVPEDQTPAEDIKKVANRVKLAGPEASGKIE